jgi:hypothetical protein
MLSENFMLPTIFCSFTLFEFTLTSNASSTAFASVGSGVTLLSATDERFDPQEASKSNPISSI